MITLALAEKMADDNVAGLSLDDDLFWEEMPLSANGKPATGVWIVTRGGSAANAPKGLNLHTTVDIYVALANKAKTEWTHQEILRYLENNMCFTELSGSVGDISYAYSNVRVRPTQTPQNDGVTENGLIVKVASVELVYDLVQS